MKTDIFVIIFLLVISRAGAQLGLSNPFFGGESVSQCLCLNVLDVYSFLAKVHNFFLSKLKITRTMLEVEIMMGSYNHYPPNQSLHHRILQRRESRLELCQHLSLPSRT